MEIWAYFTKEQQDEMMRLTARYNSEEIKHYRKEANEIVKKLREGMEAGISSSHSEMASNAKRLREIQDLFNGRDPAIEQAIARFHQENPEAQVHGIDWRLYQYIQEAGRNHQREE